MPARYASSNLQDGNLTDAEDKPLAGKRVVITRAPEQARELLQQLSEAGAEALLLPCVAFSPAPEPRMLDEALRSLDQFDWVVFTSHNAVEACAQRAGEIAVSLKAAGTGPHIAAVGPATANAASRAGFRVDVVAKQFRGEHLAAELAEAVAGKRVFLPRSNCAGRELPAALAALGANVTEAVAYETGLPKTLDRDVLGAVRDARVDVLTFFSPSALRNLLREMGLGAMSQLAGRVAFAAIGPTTAKAILDEGLHADIIAEQARPSALVDAIKEFFVRRQQARFGSAAR